MNVPLLVAGSMAIVAAGVHGAGGEVLVVRKLSREMLPSSPFGGPVMTMTMIHATWHMTTIAFLSLGCGLVLSGSVLHGDTARWIGLVGASTFSGFALVAVGMGAAYMRSPRAFFRHLGPAALTAIAVLAWWGIA